VLALALAALGAAGCGASPDTISRDEFVASYVALRVAELEEPIARWVMAGSLSWDRPTHFGSTGRVY
jgi:hypothetical protein